MGARLADSRARSAERLFAKVQMRGNDGPALLIFKKSHYQQRRVLTLRY